MSEKETRAAAAHELDLTSRKPSAISMGNVLRAARQARGCACAQGRARSRRRQAVGAETPTLDRRWPRSLHLRKVQRLLNLEREIRAQSPATRAGLLSCRIKPLRQAREARSGAEEGRRADEDHVFATVAPIATVVNSTVARTRSPASVTGRRITRWAQTPAASTRAARVPMSAVRLGPRLSRAASLGTWSAAG
jgi:hypothetical protein